MMANSEHKFMVKQTHGVNIPKLDFGVVMGEINSRLKEIRNPGTDLLTKIPGFTKAKQDMGLERQQSDYALIQNQPSIPAMPKFDPIEHMNQNDLDAIHIKSKYLDTSKYPMISRSEPTRLIKDPLILPQPNIDSDTLPNKSMSIDPSPTTNPQNPPHPTDPVIHPNAATSNPTTSDPPTNTIPSNVPVRDDFEIPEELISHHSEDSGEELSQNAKENPDADMSTRKKKSSARLS
jgi:hypothetical protein